MYTKNTITATDKKRKVRSVTEWMDGAVRQKCPLSPIVFNMYLNEVAKNGKVVWIIISLLMK
jgi:hypothetical protein